ncbi:MAG: trypsin-like peptidase domain-containing protein [Spirochaetota bacterium]
MATPEAPMAGQTQRFVRKSLPLKGYTGSEANNIEVYENTNRAVVNITALKETQVFNWFFEPIPREDEAIGSGSIIDTDGYILTNNHVVQNASKLLITLYDGSQVKGEIVGSDPENDLAIVRFAPNGRKLHTLAFVQDEHLQVGQKVFAIGNPYGFERTLTVGIVSGLGRPIQNENGLIIQDMIQTDASINPGNSGGPLLNSQGKMIGVNSAIYSPSGGSVGLGFAVPISTVKRVLPDLIQYGEVRRGWIDIQVIPLFPQLVRYSRLPVEKGLLVSQVFAGSEAEKAGLRGGERNQAVRRGNQVIYLGGDIITQIQDMEVASMADLYSALEPTRPGELIRLTIIRDGKERNLNIKLSKRKHS